MPLYEQIANRVRVAIASGELRPAAALPSVRQLAAELRVNPATVVQAYRDLEAEGFVRSAKAPAPKWGGLPPAGPPRGPPARPAPLCAPPPPPGAPLARALGRRRG